NTRVAMISKKANDSDRIYLTMQIRLRGLRLAVLNQYLADFSDVSRRDGKFTQTIKQDRQRLPA
ncbi:MAG: hypothetical protein PS018_01115, partial [bacterium]|nr:hypothetical protein [bacterium]